MMRTYHSVSEREQAERKRKRLITATVTVSILIFSIAYFGINVNPLKDLNVSDVSTIMFYIADTEIAITDRKDIELIVDELQLMHLRRKMNPNKDGGYFAIIELKDGSSIPLVYLGINEIAINGRFYHSNNTYVEDLRSIAVRIEEEGRINRE